MMVSPASYSCLTVQEAYWKIRDCVSPTGWSFLPSSKLLIYFSFPLIAAGSLASHLIFARIARLPVWALPWQHWFDLRGLGPLLKGRCMPCALLSTVRLRIKKCQKLLISPKYVKHCASSFHCSCVCTRCAHSHVLRGIKHYCAGSALCA